MDSPFHPHLRTNYVPCVEEIGAIAEILEDADKAINDFDMDIDKLQQQLRIVQNTRSTMKDYADQHRALTTPARSISRDVLEEIFLACLPTDRNPCMSAREAPLLLSQVCSSWREIALSTPRLWASIHIVLPGGPAKYIRVHKESMLLRLRRHQVAVNEWIERSRTYPLSISIYQSDPYDFHRYDYAFEIPRAEEIELQAEMEGYYSEFLTSAVVPWSNRWYEMDVYLSGTAFHVLFALNSNSQSMQRMPKLKTLHVTIQSKKLGLNQNRTRWKEISDAISQCSSVKKLGIYFSYSQTPYDWSSKASVHLPYLKFLTLSASSPPTIQMIQFSELLCIPSLEALNFNVQQTMTRDHTYQRGHVQEILRTLLRDCGGRLESLEIHNSTILEVDDIVLGLRLCPKLRHLKLSPTVLGFDYGNRWNPMIEPMSALGTVTVTNTLLESLTPHDSDYSSVLCPVLESLVCRPQMLANFSPQVIRRFVSARRKAHELDNRIACLRRFCVYINDIKPIDDPNEEKIMLGENSAVYYLEPDYQFSPWEGLSAWREEHAEPRFRKFVMYNEV